jgi:hypothetical protein
MGNERDVVSAREHYPWELEFPSLKSARLGEKLFAENKLDFYREDELIFVQADRARIALLLRELGFESTWLTLEQQGTSLG